MFEMYYYTAGGLSFAAYPTLTTNMSLLIAHPIALHIGLSIFLLAVLFLSPSPTNNLINIAAIGMPSISLSLILLIPSEVAQNLSSIC